MTWERAIQVLTTAAGADVNFMLCRQNCNVVPQAEGYEEQYFELGISIRHPAIVEDLRTFKIAGDAQLELAVNAALDVIANWRLLISEAPSPNWEVLDPLIDESARRAFNLSL